MARALEPDDDYTAWVAERDGAITGVLQVEKAPPRRDGGTRLAGRGAARRAVRVTDALLPDNDGVSALHTGHVTASALAWHGRTSAASAGTLAALDEAFRTPQPFMIDQF